MAVVCRPISLTSSIANKFHEPAIIIIIIFPYYYYYYYFEHAAVKVCPYCYRYYISLTLHGVK